MHKDFQEQWLIAFIDAVESGADVCTAKAIAYANTPIKNPASRIPPRRKGKPSTWKMTKTGRYRARLGSLPDKWKSEWVRRYKSALKKQEKRKDLNEAQQKTIAAKQAWDAIKKQGCRLPGSIRPSSRKAVYKSPNIRARDREEFQTWICPEWEETEQARKKVTEQVVRESERVEKRERARQRKAGAQQKRQEKRQRSRRRYIEKLAREEEKARRKKQTPKEYGEEFRKKYGAPGLLPERARRVKAPTAKDIRQQRKKYPQKTKEYDPNKKYQKGDIIFHPDYYYGQVVSTGKNKMTVKFEMRGRDRKSKRDFKMGS